MKKYSPAFWAAIKADYCSGARSVAEIAAYYGVFPGTVYTRRKKGNWKRTDKALPPIALTLPDLDPPDGASRNLTPRLTKLLERTVAEIELAAGTEKTDEPTSMDRARDVRTLATVMRLLGELKTPAPEANAPKTLAESQKNDILLRQEIATRIGRLRDAGRLD